MFSRVKDYIQDNEFRLTIFKDRVYVINYLEILAIATSLVSLKTETGKIIIRGKNLCLNKLLDKELLISGVILSVEVNDAK